MNLQPLFTVIEGIDGSGKGTVIEYMGNWVKKQGMKLFDLPSYEKTHHKKPDPSELEGFHSLFSAEPTFCGIGEKIRTKSITTDNHSSPQEIAEAFAKDRDELYKKIIIPQRKKMLIIQDRSFVSSLVYQPAYSKKSDFEQICRLNSVALSCMPDYVVILKVNPASVMERLQNREKKDNAIFENLSFQTQIQKRYEEKSLQKFLEERGSKVIFLDANGTQKETENEVEKKVIPLLF